MSDKKPSKIFPKRLRYAREELRKMSQVKLSEKTGMPSTSIAHFEGAKRTPSFDNLAKLAAALDVSTDFLIGRVDTPDGTTAGDTFARHGAKLSNENREIAIDFMKMLKARDAERKSKG